ncbi:MAG: alpha/beta hydrolase [Myxococcaceae bacterium]
MASTLFVHSTGTGPFMWDPIEVPAAGERLQPANLGYPPHAPLARGTKFTVGDDVRHLLAGLPPGDGPLDVVAHSYGGLLALKLVPHLGRRVRSLCLFEPVMFGALVADPDRAPEAQGEVDRFLAMPWFVDDEARGGTAEWLEVFIDYWNRPGSWARMPELMKTHSLAMGWKMFVEVRSVFRESGRYEDNALPAVPVTLAYGERSPVGSREVIRALSARHAHAKVVVMPGTGHMAPLTHPSKVAEVLAGHFARR